MHGFYIEHMSTEHTTQSADIDLQRLESRIDDLLQTCDRLIAENKSLHDQQDNLVSERAELVEKTELARSRVEAMIARLRSMEQKP